MFPACLILTNASLKCKKFQNISLFIFRRQKSLSYRFFTASINLFPYFSYLCLPTPVTFSISSSFPGFRIHIWIRDFVGKDHIRGNFFLSGDLQAKSTELLKKGLILFSQITDCRFRKSAPFLFFLQLLLFWHFHCEDMAHLPEMTWKRRSASQ